MRKTFLVTLLLAALAGLSSPVKSNCAASGMKFTDSTAALPYDAEVEYIDSIVPAFIDTGITVSPSCIVEVDVQCLSAGGASLGTIMGVNGDRYMFRYDGSSSLSLNVVSRGSASGYGNWVSIKQNPKTRHLYTYGSEGIAVDGVILADESTSTVVFNAYSPTFKIAGGFNAANARGGNNRYWRVSIWKDGELVRDFQPVRFTNENGETEGAMYDKVTKTLFANSNVGNGTFTSGPDK